MSQIKTLDGGKEKKDGPVLTDLFRKNSTDIWFTMGPGLNGGSQKKSKVVLDTLVSAFQSGAYGVRTNFIDGTRELQEDIVKVVRSASKIAGKKAALIADLQGEKTRLGSFPKSINLKNGDSMTLFYKDLEPKRRGRSIPVTSHGFFERVAEGDRVIVGDNSASLKILKNGSDYVECVSVGEGAISPRRGLSIQSGSFQPTSMTEQDQKDAKKIAESGLFDAIALSFVSSAAEVKRAREIVNDGREEIAIISKIESQRGVRHLEEILKVSDAIMVARGDLALYAPWQELGNIVDIVVDTSKRHGKPWIMATQLVSGLEHFTTPTRAEICDLTHWVKEGASAVMLGDETAFGTKPIESISSVKSIIDAVRGREEFAAFHERPR